MDHLEHAHDDVPVERSAHATLDQIREGGQALVVLVQARLADCAQALSEGRFYDALQHTQEVATKLHGLAQAEGSLASLAESFIIRAEQVEEGMVIRGHGTVASVSRDVREIPGSDEPCVHIQLGLADGEPLDLHAGQEVVIARVR